MIPICLHPPRFQCLDPPHRQCFVWPTACRRCFRSHSKAPTAVDAELFTSPYELRALVRVFGLYGARELGRRAEHTLMGVVASLDAALSAGEVTLTAMRDKFKVRTFYSLVPQ